MVLADCSAGTEIDLARKRIPGVTSRANMKTNRVVQASLLLSVLSLGGFRAAGELKRDAIWPIESVASSPEVPAAQLFSRHCASCHGRDGQPPRGTRTKGVRNLTDAVWQNSVSDERIFNVIDNGKGKMPAFNKKLTQTQVDDLVTYVRGLKR